MSWDAKKCGNKKRFYYYRSTHECGRSIKIYLGRGAAAEEAARQDAEARRQREQRKQEWLLTWAKIKQTKQPSDEFCRTLNLVVKVVLIASGFHQHERGEWRRRSTRHG